MITYSKVITPNALDPVWLSEAKAHLKIDGTDEDDLITKKIMTATAMCERYAGLSFMTQTRRVALDRFCGDIVLPYGPVQSITDFIYIDENDAEQDVDPATYTLDTHSGISVVRVLESWPATNKVLNNIQLDYVAGFDLAADVYPEAKEAILRLTTRLYEDRGDENQPLMTEEITDLLDMIKVYWIA